MGLVEILADGCCIHDAPREQNSMDRADKFKVNLFSRALDVWWDDPEAPRRLSNKSVVAWAQNDGWVVHGRRSRRRC